MTGTTKLTKMTTKAVAATTVNSIAALRTAISDNTIPRILVAAGTYAFTDRMPGCLRSALCINRTVTIEAVSHATVVFDAQAGGRTRRLNLPTVTQQLNLHSSLLYFYVVTKSALLLALLPLMALPLSLTALLRLSLHVSCRLPCISHLGSSFRFPPLPRGLVPMELVDPFRRDFLFQSRH